METKTLHSSQSPCHGAQRIGIYNLLDRHPTLLSLLAKVLGRPGRSTLLSLLAKVLGPGEEGRSTLLSLLATGLGPAPPQRPRLTHPFNWSEPASSSLARNRSTGSTASKLGDQAQSSESLGSDPRERAGVGQRTKLPAPPTNQLRHETCVGLFGGHLLWTGFGL